MAKVTFSHANKLVQAADAETTEAYLCGGQDMIEDSVHLERWLSGRW